MYPDCLGVQAGPGHGVINVQRATARAGWSGGGLSYERRAEMRAFAGRGGVWGSCVHGLCCFVVLDASLCHEVGQGLFELVDAGPHLVDAADDLVAHPLEFVLLRFAQGGGALAPQS